MATTIEVEGLPNDPSVITVPGAGLVSITVVSTPTTLYTITPNRTARIKKIMWFNRSNVGGLLQIGFGAFTQIFPSIMILAGLDGELTEDMIPSYWFRQFGSATANIVGQMVNAGAIPVDVFIEVEEKGAF